jgi:hypothetical protein
MIVIDKNSLSPKTNAPETETSGQEILFDKKFLIIKNNVIEQYDSNANPEPTQVKLIGGEGSLPAKKEEPTQVTVNPIFGQAGADVPLYDTKKDKKEEPKKVESKWYESPFVIGAIALVVGGLIVYLVLKA